MEKIENFLAKYIYLVILALSLPSVWALFVPGFYGASDDVHIAWLYEMDKVIKSGQIPPRFVPDLSYQFGYPLFNFVFPLPFYLGEIFHFLGLSFVDSIKAVFLISVPLSAIFMYQLLRRFSGVSVSLAGAILYIYTPYRATDLYVRGAIGEIMGFIFLPLITWSIISLGEAKQSQVKLKWVGVGGLAIAGLILTHNITAYMFMPLAVLLVLGLLIFKGQRLLVGSFLVMFLLGVLISVYFWYPAVMDSQLMKYDTVFNFADHFPTLGQLIKPYWGYGASVPGPYDGMSFFVGVFNWFGFLAGIPLFFWFRKKISLTEKMILIWGYLIFLIAIFMMNYRSTFIWNSIPQLNYFQFPWRFLILTTFASGLFFVLLEKVRYHRQISLVLVLLIISLNTFQFRPQDFLGRIDGYFLNKYIPVPKASEEYGQTQEEYLRLPKETMVRPNDVYPTIFSDQRFESSIKKVNDLNLQLNLIASQPIDLNYNKYNFPGWVAEVDGKAVKLNSGRPFGQINFQLTAGAHQVLIYFTETNLKKALDVVSLVSLLLALFLVVFKPKISSKYV